MVEHFSPSARILWWACLMFTGLMLGGCAADRLGSEHRFEFTRLCMGVQTRIVVYAPSEQEGAAGASQAFDRIAELDAAMSDYRADSELMTLCSAFAAPEAAQAEGAGGMRRVRLSPDLYESLDLAQTIALCSRGGFDVTVGPAVGLWREARRTGKMPEAAALEKARALVGWQKLMLEPLGRTARLSVPGMRLDLGGIGKGYAAERAVQTLKKLGLNQCMVALAGDIVVGDAPPGEEGWLIAVAANPGAGRGGGGASAGPAENEEESQPRLVLSNAAVSTSGDAEQFVEIEGKRYSHIIDPRTGLGTTNRTAATVVASSGELADALATALSVVGSGQARSVLRSFPEASAVIVEGGSDQPVTTTIDRARRLKWYAKDGTSDARRPTPTGMAAPRARNEPPAAP